MIALIPAKGTSERVPGKNMRLLGGKPLVQWTIEAAIDSEVFEKVVVSSDSSEILSLAAEFGCILHNRPPDYAKPLSTIFEVCTDIVEQMRPDSFAMLSPTSPFRDSAMIQYAHLDFEHLNLDCLMSVTDYEYPPQWALRAEGNYLMPDSPIGYKTKRQDLGFLGKHDGSIIMCNTDKFLEVDDWIKMRTSPYYLPEEKAVDIDTELDLLWAEFLLSDGGK